MKKFILKYRGVERSDEAQLLSWAFSSQSGLTQTIQNDYFCVFNENAILESLIGVFTISDKATIKILGEDAPLISSITVLDFSINKTLLVRVTAEDGVTYNDYSINVLLDIPLGEYVKAVGANINLRDHVNNQVKTGGIIVSSSIYSSDEWDNLTDTARGKGKQLYIIGPVDPYNLNDEYIIEGRTFLAANQEHVFQIAFDAYNNGQHELFLDRVYTRIGSTTFNGEYPYQLYLEDTDNGNLINLRTTPSYMFDTSAGIFRDRFLIRVKALV